jgi:hypothetical protein
MIDVVQPGDTLFGITQRFLGDGNKWPLIYHLNRQTLDRHNGRYVQLQILIFQFPLNINSKIVDCETCVLFVICEEIWDEWMNELQTLRSTFSNWWNFSSDGISIEIFTFNIDSQKFWTWFILLINSLCLTIRAC